MNFLTTYFDNTQVTLLVMSAIFFIVSLFFQTSQKGKYSLVFLGLTALCLFGFAALLDPFLCMWDERFHALVAKNMINHPLMPTLYDDPVVNMAYDKWDRYHIWLHKQPLFLWQIALSFKIFGISEFTLRIPSIVLGMILVIVTYRSGKLLVNQRVGYISGILMMTTFYIVELIAGRQAIEHNDVAFLAYISLSIWSFIEYNYTRKKKWIYLIGLFSGMAILCKWLIGLLVYFGWFLLRILQKKFKLSENKDILKSIPVALLIAAPWQIFTFIRYPAEAAEASRFNILHFLTAVDGLSGDIWYHFIKFNTIYGVAGSFLIIPSLYIMYKRCNDKNLFYSLLGMVLFVYVFFTVAASKMPSFTIIASMMIIIAFGSLLDYIFYYLEKYIKPQKMQASIFIVSILVISLFRLDIEYLQERHTTWKNTNIATRMLTHNKEVFKSLDLPEKTVLFNVKGRHYIEAMFYTGLSAYNFIPSYEQYKEIKEKGRNIAIFNSNRTEIPDYLKNDSTIILIDKEIKGYQ